MSDKDKQQAPELENQEDEIIVEAEVADDGDDTTNAIEPTEADILRQEADGLRQELEEMKRESLFRAAEFENFRRRVAKEKAELIKYGAETAMRNLLPIIDDFERGLAAMKDSNDANAVREGIEIIYKNFIKYLDQNGVKAIESNGNDFDTDYHEAIALTPAPDASLKGKVIDTVTKGYTIHDKVLRHAKVAVGE